MSIIDDYLDEIPKQQKDELERIRKTVNHAVPEAEEVMTYGMPGFKYKGKYLIAFASFKNHMSIFPGAVTDDSIRQKLSKFKMSKGTIQFTADNPIPEPILKEIIANCVARIASAKPEA